MNQKQFEDKNVKRISSPEEFDETVRAVRPKVWLMIVVLGVFAAALLVWGFCGTIKSTVPIVGYLQDKTIICLLPPQTGMSVAEGMIVEANGKVIGKVNSINTDPIKKSELSPEYTNDYYLNALITSDYVMVTRIDAVNGDIDADGDRLVEGQIVLHTFRPIDFLIDPGVSS